MCKSSFESSIQFVLWEHHIACVNRPLKAAYIYQIWAALVTQIRLRGASANVSCVSNSLILNSQNILFWIWLTILVCTSVISIPYWQLAVFGSSSRFIYTVKSCVNIPDKASYIVCKLFSKFSIHFYKCEQLLWLRLSHIKAPGDVSCVLNVLIL